MMHAFFWHLSCRESPISWPRIFLVQSTIQFITYLLIAQESCMHIGL